MDLTELWDARLAVILTNLAKEERDHESLARLSEQVVLDCHGRFLIELVHSMRWLPAERPLRRVRERRMRRSCTPGVTGVEYRPNGRRRYPTIRAWKRCPLMRDTFNCPVRMTVAPTDDVGGSTAAAAHPTSQAVPVRTEEVSMTRTMTVREYEAHPEDALAAVGQGDTIVVVRDGQPVARILPALTTEEALAALIACGDLTLGDPNVPLPVPSSAPWTPLGDLFKPGWRE